MMNTSTHLLKVQVTHLVDEAFPGFVECQFQDVEGCKHAFIEKLPIVSARDTWPTSEDFPFIGYIACVVGERMTGEDGRLIAKIDTATPWSIESQGGNTRFRVFYSDLEPSLS